jgi:hypothetical protein
VNQSEPGEQFVHKTSLLFQFYQMIVDPFSIEDVVADRKRKSLREVPSCYSNKMSTKGNLKLRWAERITSSNISSANFSYEITFSAAEALQFEAVSTSVYYSEDSDDFLECYAIKSVKPFFSNVIYSGDLLLRVNGQSLLRKSVNGEFMDAHKTGFLEIIAAAAAPTAATSVSTVPAVASPAQIVLGDAATPITIRFLRAGSSSLNFNPSPVELNLFQVDKHIAARYQVIKQIPALVGAAELNRDMNDFQQSQINDVSLVSHWSIQLTYLEQQVHKKMHDLF